jgi:hypothetical protein
MFLSLLLALITATASCSASENQFLTIAVGNYPGGTFTHTENYTIHCNVQYLRKDDMPIRLLYNTLANQYGLGTLLATCKSQQAFLKASLGAVEIPNTYMVLDVSYIGSQTVRWLLKNNHLNTLELLRFRFVLRTQRGVNS